MRIAISGPDLAQNEALARLLQKHGHNVFDHASQTLGQGVMLDPTCLILLVPSLTLTLYNELKMRRSNGNKTLILGLFGTNAHRINDPAPMAVALLNAGADDAQPIHIDPKELSARLTALSNRDRSGDEAETIGDMKLENSMVRIGGNTIYFTQHEFAVLSHMFHRPGQTISKQQLMSALYPMPGEPKPKVIDVYLCKVRAKLALVSTTQTPVLENVWGQGWRLVPPARGKSEASHAS